MLPLVKAAVWIVALASGTSGGVLAPLLVLGALGAIEGQFLPGGSGLWALLGMAAMMGATMRAPLTGALFAVELTGALGLLLPLLAATGSAYAVTVLVLKRSILTEKIARRGQHVTREYSVDPFELLRVKDVMVTEVDSLPSTMAIDEPMTFFGKDHRHRSYPVVAEDGRVVGLVTRANLLRWSREREHEAGTLHDLISDASLLIGHADEVVGHIADRMVRHDVARVPIVDAAGRLIGLVARKDLLRIRAHSGGLETDRQAFFGPATPAVR